MSCVRFVGGKPQNGGEPVAKFWKPFVTKSKLERLRKLTRDDRVGIRESAALNPSLPLDCFRYLIRDDEPSVRECLARNVNAPDSMLLLLAGDADPDVRAWVAVHPKTSDWVLDKLVDDYDENVSFIAATIRATRLFA